MNSIISLDGNDIFEVARIFERMNINELGDITEIIPEEIKIFDQNSSAYSSTNNAWKSWLKEFDSLYGHIQAYEFKSDANKSIPKNRTGRYQIRKNQVEAQMERNLDRERRQDNFGDVIDELVDTVDQFELDYHDEVDTMEQQKFLVLNYIEEQILNGTMSVYLKHILLEAAFTELSKSFGEVVKDLRDGAQHDEADAYETKFVDEILLNVEESTNEIEEKIISLIESELKETNTMKAKIDESIQSSVSNAVITELSSLKDAIPIINALNETLASNMVNWKNLFSSASLNVEKSDVPDFEYKLQSDIQEMIEILVKYKRDTKIYKETGKKLEKLQTQINNLLTNQEGIGQIANTVPYVNIDNETPQRFLASNYEAGDDVVDDAGDDGGPTIADYNDNIFDSLSKDSKLKTRWDNTYQTTNLKSVNGLKTVKKNVFLRRIGYDEQTFDVLTSDELIQIINDLNETPTTRDVTKLGKVSLQNIILRRLSVDQQVFG